METSNTWQPIETAPIDSERPILMTDGKWYGAGHCHSDSFLRKYTIHHWAVSQEYDWEPTHWMPLPNQPQDGLGDA